PRAARRVSPEGYDAILADIDAELAAGRPVYVHCWGGVGRTGTVVGLVHVARRGRRRRRPRRDPCGTAGNPKSPPAGIGDGVSGGGHPPSRDARASEAPLTHVPRRAAKRSQAKTFQAFPENKKPRLRTGRRRCRLANSRRGRRWRHPGPHWPARSPTPS
ncbi:MAG: hypothetical protein EXS06_10930, partial [Planctomycetaceae bacterium]|nr:hypothetical protein [Planctomycetaceae bacterium]